MRELPEPAVYEQEFEFMPWGTLIDRILAIIQNDAPENGSVLDLMCGPGYLLGEISKIRTDLTLDGVDINDNFVQHAQGKYPNISFQIADVLSLHPTKQYDLVLCTGGLHHLPYDRQAPFLETIPELMNPNGFAIFADPYIDDFSDELERRQSAAKLGYEYILATIKNGAPDDIVKATINILYNDLMGFEYKTSLNKLEPVFRRIFSHVQITKTWPEANSEFGDYFMVCKNRKKK